MTKENLREVAAIREATAILATAPIVRAGDRISLQDLKNSIENLMKLTLQMSPFDLLRQKHAMSPFDRLKLDVETGNLQKKLQDPLHRPIALFFCFECAGTGKWRWEVGGSPIACLAMEPEKQSEASPRTETTGHQRG